MASFITMGSRSSTPSARPSVVECLQCGAAVAVKPVGRVPRYCSARCGRRFRSAASRPAARPGRPRSIDLSGGPRPLALPERGPAALPPPAPGLPALPEGRAAPQLPARSSASRVEPEPADPASRFELAPHLPVEPRSRPRKHIERIIRPGEQHQMAVALDFVMFALSALVVLAGSLWFFGPPGFLVWLFVGVPVLWFAVMGRHIRRGFR